MTSDLRDPTFLRERLREQSRTYARRGATRPAQLAAWTSDLHVLEQLLWQNGLAEAPDPDAQLAAVGEAVAASLDILAESDLGELTPQLIVDLARDALVNTFDESVRQMLADEFMPLDHLVAAVWEPAGEDDPTDGRGRLGDRSPEQLVVELLAAAGDCMAVARELVVEGEFASAQRLSRQADIASFEAYLVAAASLAGDHELASVELRWDAAVILDRRERAAEHGGSMADLAEVITTRRRELLALLGSAEQGILELTFEPVPEQ